MLDLYAPSLTADAEPFAVYKGQVVSRENLWSDVNALSKRLPDRPYLFNLCENRYLFCVCLLAAALRRQTCLLPPSNQMAVIDEIRRDYPGAYLASDKPLPNQVEYHKVEAPITEALTPVPALDWDRTAVIAFTSGSSGRPKPCPHSLKTFALSADMAVRALELWEQRRLMISTTPPQHMYGLETSVFWPLFSKLILYDGRPFFAEDIRQAIAAAPWGAMLISTPTHLRSLVKAEGDWSNLIGVISATDTLSKQLAGETRAILGQSPREIYGSTETLSFACRETLNEHLWHPYPGSRVTHDQSGQTRLESPHLPTSFPLQDTINVSPDGRFEVLGRNSDMVKIGGKRTSLSELNRRLKDIEGVEDGFCFLQQDGDNTGRVLAVVVSRLSKEAIRHGLQPYVDEVFLPRKIHFVSVIARNETGKLTKTAQEAVLGTLKEPI